jgi:GNAT superfamily N-acetyltransferase
MARDVKIRPAAEPDISVLVSLIRALGEYEKAPPGAVPVTERLLRDALFGERPSAEALLALVGSEVAGYAIFFHNFSTWRARPGVYLEDLFVLPQHRGGGIGKALLKHVARIAVERGCPRMEWMVLDWNQPAIEFYRSLGAITLDEWTTFRLQDEALSKVAKS